MVASSTQRHVLKSGLRAQCASHHVASLWKQIETRTALLKLFTRLSGLRSRPTVAQKNLAMPGIEPPVLVARTWFKL
jgi:hypothetical protein